MNKQITSVKELGDVTGQRVFLRGALNVPVADGEITNDYRLKNLLPTINYLREHGARIILGGHMSGNEKNSFAPVAAYLRNHFDLTFVEDYINGQAKGVVEGMDPGDVVLFENLRQHSGEKANDPNFSKMLAAYADIYVNDGFPAAHRPHASVVGVPDLLPAYAGLRFEEEVKQLLKALDPQRPFTFILGGAKFSTKLPLVEKFSQIASDVFVGGAIANAYLKADGHPLGSSRLPEKTFDLSVGLASSALNLPTDVVVQSEAGLVGNRSVENVGADELVVDLGRVSVKAIVAAVKNSKLVVWNGPLGWYEKGFSEGTDQLANAISQTDTTSILGGGDTAAVILDNMTADDFSFVSTAGGAMIDFLANESLPGIEALK